MDSVNLKFEFTSILNFKIYWHEINTIDQSDQKPKHIFALLFYNTKNVSGESKTHAISKIKVYIINLFTCSDNW